MEIQIPINGFSLTGDLILPEKPLGIVLFAHGSGSSRHSPRNRYVAEVLQQRQIATLLFDLLTVQEDQVYETRFDINLLTERLLLTTEWIWKTDELTKKLPKELPTGYFGASTGAAAALQAAAQLGSKIAAVVSRGGRPDLAMERLPQVQAPTLLLVGGDDYQVIELNQLALDQLQCQKELSIIPSATHLFEEPGTLEEVARQAAAWFERCFG